MKCPNCGAPINGKFCSYCGTSVPAEPADGTGSAGKKTGRGKRSALDIVLIALGAIWCLIAFAVAVDLQYWRQLSEIIAAFFLAAPGIVLLLIGCRRKPNR